MKQEKTISLTMFIFLYFWSVIFAAITNPLDQFCEDTSFQFEWEEVPETDWYWGTDYDAQITAGEVVYPAGFRSFTLYEYNQPPVCLTVPGSGDKKVEIMIQTVVEDAHICIHDASDIGFANNDVGNVDTCAIGLLYSCFTAAESETSGVYEDFSFYVYCKESCEQSEVALWIRARTSNQTWEAGKTGVDDDLEMWCEMEKGTVLNDTEGNEHYFFTYPEDLIDDNPTVWPFHIEHIIGTSTVLESGGSSSVTQVLVGIFGALFLLIAAFCTWRNHDQLPECCQKLIPCVDETGDSDLE